MEFWVSVVDYGSCFQPSPSGSARRQNSVYLPAQLDTRNNAVGRLSAR
jgi:hypothetical protein